MHDLSRPQNFTVAINLALRSYFGGLISTSLPIITSRALFVLNLSYSWYSRLVYLQKTHIDILIYIAT
jgi:hypothetical protein